MHLHLTAHRDLGKCDIVHNFGGSVVERQYELAIKKKGPFRTLLPCRYYLVDFELAIQFSPAANAEQRLVRGLPCVESHGCNDPGKYGKVKVLSLPLVGRLSADSAVFVFFSDPASPEWLDGEAYCPFRSDVYQLAGLWQKVLLVSGSINLCAVLYDESVRQLDGPEMQSLQKLFSEMMHLEAAQRPSASQALEQLQRMRNDLPEACLACPIQEAGP